MTILVTGGAGYVGTKLIKKLIIKNKVIVIDTMWFGNYLSKSKNLQVIKKNILDLDLNNKYFKNVKVIIHLASIASDPASELDPKYTWEISCLGTKKICEIAKKNKVKKVIFASSGSVYGIKNEKKVTENLSMVPISDYNKTKMIAEDVVKSYGKFFKFYIIRPGTVYGFSPRMRLDLMINILTYQALKYKKLKLFGGKQIRPFIHIDDMVSVYLHFTYKNLPCGIYNASCGNLSVEETAKKIKNLIKDVKIIKNKTNDPRSYRLDSSKLRKTGFKFKTTFDQGVQEIISKFKKGKIKNKSENYSINWVKRKKF